MDKKYLKETANTILKQLNYKKSEMWAWGAKDFKFREREYGKKKYPALMFSIRTPKIPSGGRVIVSYHAGYDEYIVEAVSVRSGNEKLIDSVSGVYTNELHSVINSLIEDEGTYRKVFF